MPQETAPALKDLLNADRHRAFATTLAEAHPAFDRKRFLQLTLTGLESRSLMQRLRRVTEALKETLPAHYPDAIDVLSRVGPSLRRTFLALVLPDFVGLYGRDHFDLSLRALKEFTALGSSEFAIREYLKRDLDRTLAVMKTWAEDPDEHARRLASEGSRPRLPWSFRLDPIVKNPEFTAPILQKLLQDPSLYVRKSVANHLNDISKDHPEWLLRWLGRQDLNHPHTRWIAKRALRTLIKKGDAQALTLIGASGAAKLTGVKFSLSPKRLKLGETLSLAFTFTTAGKSAQHLVIDYALHYVKSSGASSAKVFKWKEVKAEPGETFALAKNQRIRDFTTRRHHPGKHRVVVHVNGSAVAESAFVLTLD